MESMKKMKYMMGKSFFLYYKDFDIDVCQESVISDI